MITQQEKFRNRNIEYNQTLTEESLGKYPYYIVTSASPLPSYRKAFYFRVKEEATIVAVNDRGGSDLSGETLTVGEEYWGDYSSLTVSTGKLVVYAK